MYCIVFSIASFTIPTMEETETVARINIFIENGNISYNKTVKSKFLSLHYEMTKFIRLIFFNIKKMSCFQDKLQKEKLRKNRCLYFGMLCLTKLVVIPLVALSQVGYILYNAAYYNEGRSF